MVRQRFFKDSKSDHRIAEVKQEFCMDREMCRIFSKAQGAIDDNASTKSPDIDKEFLVCTDASKEGLGIVLMQDGHVITYISRKLRKRDENYMTHDLELLATLYALRVWRHYLIGHKFELKMYHCFLQHFFTQSDLNA
jgi:hypothetical protein